MINLTILWQIYIYSHVGPMRPFFTALLYVAVSHWDVFHSVGSASTPVKVPHAYSYCCFSKSFPCRVNARGLVLLLLLAGDVSVNPGPVFGLLNARSVRNKCALIADTVTTHDFDFVSLTETHIRPSDTAGLLHSITPPEYVFCTDLVNLVVVVVLDFL